LKTESLFLEHKTKFTNYFLNLKFFILPISWPFSASLRLCARKFFALFALQIGNNTKGLDLTGRLRGYVSVDLNEA